MHEINSRRLSHVVALAEEGSFARAASRVHLSQPALSRSIQALEDELGMKLFDRAARGVALTAAGRLLVERARRVLFETRCMFRDVELLKAHELGEVKIGLGPYAAVVLLPDLLVEFSRRFPKIKVLIELREGDELMQKLREERVDFVVTDRRVPPVAPDLALPGCRVTKAAGSRGRIILCWRAARWRCPRCGSFRSFQYRCLDL